MNTSHGIERFDATSVEDFMIEALKQSHLAGINKMLQLISTSLNAAGCILWAQPRSIHSQGEILYTLAHHFDENDTCVLHNIRFDKSLAGVAIKNNESFFITDVEAPDYQYYSSCAPLIEATGIRAYISVPVHFLNMASGALNIYFNQPFDAKPEWELEYVERIAILIPSIYRTIRDKIGYNLLKQVNQIFYQAGLASSKQFSHEQMHAILKQVCRCVSTAFDAKDCSILLDDKSGPIPHYFIRGTTSPEWIHELNKTTYFGKPDTGLVDWCLHFQQPIRIFDLARFQQDREVIQKEYPGIVWRDPLKIVNKAKKKLKIRRSKDLPPISFMAAPIMLEEDGALVGAIRCVMSTKGPFYFSDDDMQLLQDVAVRLGEAWRSWINRRSVEQENALWKNVVANLGSLNNFVHGQFKSGKLDEKALYDKVYELIRSIVPEAKIMAIRLYDKKKNALVYKHFKGKLWHYRPDGTNRSKAEIRSLTKAIIPLDTEDVSWEKACFTGNDVVTVGNFDDEFQGRYDNRPFTSIKSMLIAPINSGSDKNLGILELQSEMIGVFPRHLFKNIFTLIGQQIGLYHRLNNIFEEQKRIFENLAHQLITPIDQAYKRSIITLKETRRRNNVEKHVLQIRGLCNKAKNVTSSLRLFVDFERGIAPNVRHETLSTDDYIKMLVLCAADNQLLTIPRMNLKYDVDEESFTALNLNKVSLNKELYMQVLNNVLENASKYSFKNNPIYIRGSLTKNERYFCTSILNKGFPITQNAAEKCTERGWRGPHAKQVTTAGSGIGLWIVDLIMRTHNGKLTVMPTSDDGWNEIKLILPITQPRAYS